MPGQLTDLTDVAIVVLQGRDVGPNDRAMLTCVRKRAETVMGIVMTEHGGSALAVLREFADIVAHVGTDRLVVDDVTSMLVHGSTP